VCSYSDGRLRYNVYDDSGQVYGGEICRHLADDPHTTPIPDTAATAIAQATANSQATADAQAAQATATADAQAAQATATAEAAPLYMHVCIENDYDALAMNCKADDKRIGHTTLH
jgi:CheY-like chemotaxis protein